MKQYSRVLLVLLDITRNTGNLEDYFVGKTSEFYLYLFPPTFTEKPSRLIFYKNGKRVFEKEFFWYKGKNKLVKILSYYLYFAYCCFFIIPQKTWIISYQVLFCLGNSFFSLVKKTRLVFVVGDYFPVRTDFFVKVYHRLVSFYNEHLNYVLYPTDMLRQAYCQPLKNYGHRDLLHYGIKKIIFKKNPQNNLFGYVGNLRDGQGIELLFDLLKKNPQLKLAIIGSGNKLDDYKKIASHMKINHQIRFYGFVETEKKMIQIVSKWQIAFAPYEPKKDNLTFYAEPSKIKLYLQYRLPVIMTNITYIAKELKDYKAGEIVDYSISSIEDAIKKIQNNYTVYLNGVERLIERYEYNRYYDEKFTFISQKS